MCCYTKVFFRRKRTKNLLVGFLTEKTPGRGMKREVKA
jgi:hypothetical protein